MLKTAQNEIDVRMECTDNDAVYAEICMVWKKYALFINPFGVFSNVFIARLSPFIFSLLAQHDGM